MNIQNARASIGLHKGPSIKYVTLFWTNVYPIPRVTLCHTSRTPPPRILVVHEYKHMSLQGVCFSSRWFLFIHSFILNIYIAPLQENYSEALPTPARTNKAVLR